MRLGLRLGLRLRIDVKRGYQVRRERMREGGSAEGWREERGIEGGKE